MKLYRELLNSCLIGLSLMENGKKKNDDFELSFSSSDFDMGLDCRRSIDGTGNRKLVLRIIDAKRMKKSLMFFRSIGYSHYDIDGC